MASVDVTEVRDNAEKADIGLTIISSVFGTDISGVAVSNVFMFPSIISVS